MRVRRVFFVLLVGCWLVLSACTSGGEKQTIRRPAKEMNLIGADLGSAYVLGQDQGLERIRQDLTAQEAHDSFDASSRYFQSTDGMVVSLVLSFNSAADAEKHLPGVLQGFEDGFSQRLPGAEFREVSVPAIGDQATMSGVTWTDPPLQLYVLAFRRGNVTNVLAVVGPQGTTTVQSVVEIAQKVEGRIQ